MRTLRDHRRTLSWGSCDWVPLTWVTEKGCWFLFHLAEFAENKSDRIESDPDRIEIVNRSDRIGSVWIRLDRIGSDRIGSDRIQIGSTSDPDPIGSDRIGLDPDRIGSDRNGSDRMRSDRIRSDPDRIQIESRSDRIQIPIGSDRIQIGSDRLQN